MTSKKETAVILQLLHKHYSPVTVGLKFKTPLQLMVATILSSQCTDKRVDIVTKNLFKKYKNVKDYAGAKQSVFEKDIYSTGFYKNKAKNIIATTNILIKEHKGVIPLTMEQLILLPGIGRKTANVLISKLTGKHIGIVVDTHVSRLSQRIGLTKNINPLKIEQDLVKSIPKKDWFFLSNALISHGRTICMARKPNCTECFLNKKCKSAFKN